jgi:hypothetical protein
MLLQPPSMLDRPMMKLVQGSCSRVHACMLATGTSGAVRQRARPLLASREWQASCIGHGTLCNTTGAMSCVQQTRAQVYPYASSSTIRNLGRVQNSCESHPIRNVNMTYAARTASCMFAACVTTVKGSVPRGAPVPVSHKIAASGGVWMDLCGAIRPTSLST